ncbi:MAG: tRNA (adenosine(37)-N6)-dimethylallyltransferase MiaA [Phycisphaerae bacterium]|jgi:tRNA dimethylallyltransferase|nr:tRNA (adenosine(37)-N6)-dimethylallyltransferase MiaA [Phycisphaerae bacterium]MCZ2398899.1 tRNA (adenosine(37)-N6)-dimethylallyltransferase MiaA [Phycisphaerae bacterium]
MEKRIVTITGCTASGKSSVALRLAERLDAEIVSVDSMKIYRGMDIGTAKPSLADRQRIPHHLVDVADPWENFSAARFVELADAAVEQIHRRRRPVVAVGGTVMYLKFFYEGMFAGPPADAAVRDGIRRRAREEGLAALHAELAGVDPRAAERIHRNDLRRIERALEVYYLTGRPISALQEQWDGGGLRRPDWAWRLIGLRRERDAASRRINARVREMVSAGLVEEARRVWSDPRGVSTAARQAVGYAELFEHFEGRMSLEAAIERIKINSRQLAKHQRTWLKRFGSMTWLDVAEDDTAEQVAERVLDLLAAP